MVELIVLDWLWSVRERTVSSESRGENVMRRLSRETGRGDRELDNCSEGLFYEGHIEMEW